MSGSPPSLAVGVVSVIDGLLGRAVERQASDVHFEPANQGLRVRYRLDGVLHDVDMLPGTLAENVIARLKVLAGLLTYRIDIPQEGSFVWQGGESGEGATPSVDIRVATFPTVRGERAVVRLMHQSGPITTVDRLGLPPDLASDLQLAAQQPHGLILVTGPAGSGKTTTLYALARHILIATPGRSVVSLEDPVEQRVEGLAQIQVAPHGELDYVRAMRSLLRQDVEVLLVGEVRDAETARIVIEAALTGHLIMSTMHSGDPAEAVVRLMEMGVASYQVVAALSVVCSQRLLRTLCDCCGGRGCESCARTGYRGRTACAQLAVMDESLRRAILVQAPVAELRRLIAMGHPTLAMDVRRLIEAGRTTEEEALRVLGTLAESEAGRCKNEQAKSQD